MKQPELIRIGIQGDRGSANEDACRIFIKRQGWRHTRIYYLLNTFRVLSELSRGKVEYGTFAYRTARGGLVQETVEAIPQFSFRKVDQIEMELHHALFCNGEIDRERTVNIVSHPHALMDHQSFIRSEFPFVNLLEEEDTAIAAQKLKAGNYPPNTLVIAPFSCKEIYQLNTFRDDLPTNRGYITTFFLVSRL